MSGFIELLTKTTGLSGYQLIGPFLVLMYIIIFGSWYMIRFLYRICQQIWRAVVKYLDSDINTTLGTNSMLRNFREGVLKRRQQHVEIDDVDFCDL